MTIEKDTRTFQIVLSLYNQPIRYIQHTIPDEWKYLMQDGDHIFYHHGGLTMDHKQLIGLGLFEYLKPQLQTEPNTLMVESAYSEFENKIFLSKKQIGQYRVIDCV